LATPLPAAFIEHVHDVLVGVFLPFDEKVNPAEHRDVGRIESAVNRPFHGVGEEEFYPLLSQKAAALFHSLVCNHCFINGNKRTAVLVLDMFLMGNHRILALSTDAMYQMAKDAAEANKKGIPSAAIVAQLAEQIESSMIDPVALYSPEAKERLGDQYDTVMGHVTRHIELGVKALESFIGTPSDEQT
jgi:death-on-curing family protein